MIAILIIATSWYAIGFCSLLLKFGIMQTIESRGIVIWASCFGPLIPLVMIADAFVTDGSNL